jgi:hypothetical protein
MPLELPESGTLIVKILQRQIIQVFGSKKTKGINRIGKMGYGHLSLGRRTLV